MRIKNSSPNRPVRTLRMLAATLIGSTSLRAELMPQGTVTRLTVSGENGASPMDYAGAIPMDLPRLPAGRVPNFQPAFTGAAVVTRSSARPGVSPGVRGNGREAPAMVPKAERPPNEGVSPREFGTIGQPFTTARNDSPTTTNKSYPSRASGKLFFNEGSSAFVCSASLIARGLVVTAAHCVAEFGTGSFYSAWQFLPGYRDGVAPYGIWGTADAWAPSSWLDGTDECVQPGVVCENDVAILAVRAKRGRYPGTRTGWYGYGWDGYGFTPDNLAQITQIGYPVCLDNGQYQERNDSLGYVNGDLSNNTLIGSLMCGGSSGGPWLVNFGTPPALTGTTPGADSAANVMVGVTSWGLVNPARKAMGASSFTSENIVALVNAACAARPAACQ